jgi:hypothetical protein
MSAAAQPNPSETWRNYTKRVALKACRLKPADFKRLYRLINEKQIDVGNSAIAGLSQTENETAEQFQERCRLVKNAFITTVQIKGFNNEVVTGHGESFFDSPLLPERILSIEYDTTFSPKALLNVTPNDRATVFLDFSRPTWLDLSALPSAPTANNSNWFITAQTEAWSTSLSTRLQDFFKERETGLDWLHGPAVYDAMLGIAGIPLSLWGAYRLGHPIVARVHVPFSIETAVYIYAFLLALNVFRVLFSYGKWVFPKIEESEKSSSGRHRVVWAAIITGIVISALWDGIKALVGQ